MKKAGVATLLAVAAAWMMPVVASAAGGDVAASPPAPFSIGELASGDRSDFRDTLIAGDRGARRVRRATASAAGGSYVTTTGETVTVYLSDAYAPSAQLNQSVADFMASLVHGSELSRVEIYLASRAELDSFCGTNAVACYDPNQELIVGPAEGDSRASDLAHEYGHHVSFNRRNDPWSAYDRGTKRWGSRLGICPGYRSGAVGRNYFTDAAEGYAEAYTVTNGGVWGGIVDDFFYPDATDQANIRTDVLQPWSGNATEQYQRRVKRREAASVSVPTPLDGTFRVRLSGPSRADLDLYLYDGRELLRKSEGRTSRESLSYTVCGESELRLVVRAYRGRGAASLAVSKP